MKKTMIAALATLVVAGSGAFTASYAQPANAPGAAQQDARHERDHSRGPMRLSAEDRSALLDARLAGFKAGLKLTPEQEKAWPALETAMRDIAKERGERMAKWREAREERGKKDRPDLIERLRNGATMMEERAKTMKTIADAAAPLYESLDTAQKRRFNVMAREMMNRHGGPRPGGPERGMHDRG
ncbi:Spy/CpxP family protein refolding chaperone [Chelatococcus asaccharovorans]|uniref:Spy/CpxP family protein refolding chaperone n=1 Tax=Chelatococcus asaccharovorans TaxID=28210 RepID=UPI00224C77C1|nr:Spy/CpxP family protein refolding chaperone [Chelatococcus asaccharovorans]CAH1665554.1 LTXXQ motif family protein [Chelatococcus asaccharovorans]CAH1681898.1 LTXXQ motif family protein [Chelatococcus asaccharovorans]